jgi:hypothetical protein
MELTLDAIFLKGVRDLTAVYPQSVRHLSAVCPHLIDGKSLVRFRCLSFLDIRSPSPGCPFVGGRKRTTPLPGGMTLPPTFFFHPFLSFSIHKLLSEHFAA